MGEKLMDKTACRVKRTLELLFSDVQQREAARRIGVSHSLLSRTLSGEREPSKTLLEKLASVPNVNPRWLFDGIGQPLLDEGTSLPVITTLPREAKTGWRAATAGDERFRISENQFSDTRYWCRLTKPTVNSWSERERKYLRVKDGDFLLLETDPKQIQSLPGRNRLGIVTHPDIAKGKPCWGILTSDGRFIAFKVNTPGNQSGQAGKAVARSTRRKIMRRKGNTETLAGAAPHVAKSDEPPSVIEINSEQVMAVVLEMTSDTLFQKVSD
jgi:transcriptional regulator with XRE-family HTH domain